MFGFLLDLLVLFGLLAYVTNRDLADELPRLCLVAFGIGVVGSLAAYQLGLHYHWAIGLVAYFIFGVVVLLGLAKVSSTQAMIVMGVFIVYRIALKLILLAMA